MAKRQVVTDAEVAPEGAAPAPPTLAAAARASTEAEAERLEGLVATATGTPAPKPAAEAAPEDDFDTWVAALPEDKRTRYEQAIVQRHAQGLSEYYGPEISQVLSDLAADPELKKMLGRMSDKKAREWVQKTAMAIYDDDRFASPLAADGDVRPDPQLEELTRTVTDLKKRDQDRENAAALDALRSERVALENTFPELKWHDPKSKEYKRVEAVVEETLERRAKGKATTTMAEVYNEYKDMWDFQAVNPPPRPAPATSSREVTGPQAPRTKFESRAGMNAMLDKHGSIGQLAAALKR